MLSIVSVKYKIPIKLWEWQLNYFFLVFPAIYYEKIQMWTKVERRV